MKKLIIKIILSLALIAICGAIVIIYKNHQKSLNTSDGQFTFIVIDIDNNTIINDIIEYEQSDELFELLNEKYDITYKKDLYGVAVYGINNLITDWVYSYLAIYVNGEYSNNGISSIPLIDNMELKLVEMPI